MFSFLILIIFILWILYRIRVARYKLTDWAAKNGYKIDSYTQQWFTWGPKNKLIGNQIVFLVNARKENERKTFYVVIGHWLWGMLEEKVDVDWETNMIG